MPDFSLAQHEVVAPVLTEEFNDAARQEIIDAVGYPTLREFVELRRHDTFGLPAEIKQYWLPVEPQIETVRQAILPKVSFLTSRRRLAEFAQDPDSGKVANLEDHQIDIFSQVAATVAGERDPQKASTCVVSPTGSGKTHILFKSIEALHTPPANKEGTSNKPARTIVFVDTNTHLYQMVDVAEKLIPDIEVGVYNMDSKDLKKPVTVMTYASFIKAEKEGVIKRGDFDNVLLDEADLALAPDTRAQMKDFMSESVAVGFTATGKYNENRHVGLLFENIIEDLDLKRAIEDGILSPAQIWLVPTGERIDIGVIPRFRDLPAEKANELSKRLNRAAISERITNDFVKQGMRGLVKCLPGGGSAHAIERAEHLNSILIKDSDGVTRRIRAAAVGSSVKESADHIAAYKRGELDVLCFVKMIGRAFDDQDTSFLIDESAPLSPVQSVQAFGRALRKKPGKVAHIVHLVDELTSGGMLKPWFTMLHALGIKDYSPGLYVGPDDSFVPNRPSYEIKPVDPLELFSHEIYRLIHNLPVAVREAYTTGPNSYESLEHSHVTTKEFGALVGKSYAAVKSFFDYHKIEGIKQGAKKYYDLRYVQIYSEYQELINGPVDESQDWITVTNQNIYYTYGRFNNLSIDPQFAQMLELDDPLLKPLQMPDNTAGRIKFGSGVEFNRNTRGGFKCYSPTQVKLIEHKLAEAQVINGAYPFQISGNLLEDFFDPEITSNKTRFPYEWKLAKTPYPNNTVYGWKAKLDMGEAYVKEIAQFQNSPLFKGLRALEEKVQSLYDEIATQMGIKGRVVLNSHSHTYGNLLTTEEYDQMVLFFTQSLPSLDAAYNPSNQQQAPEKIEVSLAHELTDLLFRDFPKVEIAHTGNWEYEKEE